MSTRSSLTHTRKYKLILSAVHMVYRLVNSTFNVKELSLRLTRLLCQFIHASSASVYLLESQKKKISLAASFNNEINVILEKRKDIDKISAQEKKVALGTSVFEKRLIGLPLIADDNIGAILIRRKPHEKPFNDFDREMLSVFAEQAVTAIKNLELYEDQQRVILESIKFIGKLLAKQNHSVSAHTPIYFKIIKAMAESLTMSQDNIDCLHYASVLHDAGAMDVPYEILSKTSQLTPDEFKVIHSHPAKSVELIKPVEFLKPVLPIILYHHEKFDGTGYPSGLKKEEIPLGARVMAVVDAFEAMILGRPYKKTLSIDEAISEIKRNSGTQFDPRVVDAFYELSKQKKFRKYLSLIKK